jgi:hypothetical protein
MKRREKKGAKAVSNRAEDWSESWPPREKAGVEDGAGASVCARQGAREARTARREKMSFPMGFLFRAAIFPQGSA